VPAVTHELSLEAGTVREAFADGSPNPEITHDTIDLLENALQILAARRREPDFQRPVWLSLEIIAFALGLLDWCMVLAAAAVAFAAYSGVMDQRLAEPGRLVLTSFLAATLFGS
jgi:hypothetical protein